MDFDWTAEDKDYRRQVKAFLKENLGEGWAGYDKTDLPQYKRDAIRFCGALGKKGWLTQNWPVEYGGQNASAWRAAILSEELWPIGEPRGPQYMNVNWIGPAIMAFGTPEQKDYHLNRISKGDVCWSQGFSEPDAGSDLASLRTRAIRKGDHYIVNGAKIWTSHTGTADFLFLLVRTDAEAEKHQGISVLLVPMDTPGLELRALPALVGEQAFAHLIFTDMKVPVSYRLGEENQGWTVVRRALQFERVGAAHYETALTILNSVIQEAQRNGLIADPEICTRIGLAYAEIEAARMLTYRVIDLRAHGSPPTADSNVARVAHASCLRNVGELAQLVFGEEGLELHAGDHGEARSGGDVRRVLTVSVASGTTEVQLDQVAQRYLNLPRIRSSKDAA